MGAVPGCRKCEKWNWMWKESFWSLEFLVIQSKQKLVNFRALTRAVISMNPVLFGVCNCKKLNLVYYCSAFCYTSNIYFPKQHIGWKPIYKFWIRVCHCLVPLTCLSLWTSGWEVAEELLEYLEPAVVIHGWTVAHTVHLQYVHSFECTTLFPMLWLPCKSMCLPQTQYSFLIAQMQKPQDIKSYYTKSYASVLMEKIDLVNCKCQGKWHTAQRFWHFLCWHVQTSFRVAWIIQQIIILHIKLLLLGIFLIYMWYF